MIDPVSVGLAAAGLVAVARAVAPQTWLLVKPLSCDLCMSWWSSILFSAAVWVDPGSVIPISPGECAQLTLASTAFSLLLTKLVNRLAT